MMGPNPTLSTGPPEACRANAAPGSESDHQGEQTPKARDNYRFKDGHATPAYTNRTAGRRGCGAASKRSERNALFIGASAEYECRLGFWLAALGSTACGYVRGGGLAGHICVSATRTDAWCAPHRGAIWMLRRLLARPRLMTAAPRARTLCPGYAPVALGFCQIGRKTCVKSA